MKAIGTTVGAAIEARGLQGAILGLLEENEQAINLIRGFTISDDSLKFENEEYSRTLSLSIESDRLDGQVVSLHLMEGTIVVVKRLPLNGELEIVDEFIIDTFRAARGCPVQSYKLRRLEVCLLRLLTHPGCGPRHLCE